MIITPAGPHVVAKLLSFREEAAAWLRDLGSDQWIRPYPVDKLLGTIEEGIVFMVGDGHTTAATITLTPDPEDGLWTDEELAEPSMFINKLTVDHKYAGRNFGGRFLDWAGERAHRASWPVSSGIGCTLGRKARVSGGTTSVKRSRPFAPSARELR